MSAARTRGSCSVAFAIYYLSFPVRAVRWKIILDNAGYDRAHGIETPNV